MSQAMITLEKFYDVWVLHMEITDRHLMRRGMDVREKAFGDAVLAMVDKYLEFMPEDSSAQGLMEMLTGDKPAPLPPEPEPEPEPEPQEDRDELRAEAEALGIDVDGRWGAARLQEEIAKARE